MEKRAWRSLIVIMALLSETIFATPYPFFDPTHNAFFDAINGWDISFGGSYLYFKAREDGLVLATTYDLGTPPYQGATNSSAIYPESGFTFSNNDIIAENLKLQPPYQSGFEVFATVKPPCTDWQMSLSYSYYTTSASHSWHSAATPNPYAPLEIGTVIETFLIYGIVAEIPPAPASSILSKLDGLYKLKIQEYQLAFSYPISYWHCFTCTPSIGLQGVLIDQTLGYSDHLTLVSISRDVDLYQSTYQKARFYSFGLSGDVAAEYAIGKGLSAFGDFGLALVCGQQKLGGFSALSLVGDGTPKKGTVSFRQNPSVLRPCLNSSFGLRYTTPQFFDLVRGRISLAWEQHLYFKQNFFLANIDLRNSENNNLSLGDLSTYGFVLSAELQF